MIQVDVGSIPRFLGQLPDLRTWFSAQFLQSLSELIPAEPRHFVGFTPINFPSENIFNSAAEIYSPHHPSCGPRPILVGGLVAIFYFPIHWE